MPVEDHSCGRDQTPTTYFAAKPYVRVGWVELNRVYIHNQESELLARARTIK